jgi:hypothetical protein
MPPSLSFKAIRTRAFALVQHPRTFALVQHPRRGCGSKPRVAVLGYPGLTAARPQPQRGCAVPRSNNDHGAPPGSAAWERRHPACMVSAGTSIARARAMQAGCLRSQGEDVYVSLLSRTRPQPRWGWGPHRRHPRVAEHSNPGLWSATTSWLLDGAFALLPRREDHPGKDGFILFGANHPIPGFPARIVTRHPSLIILLRVLHLQPHAAYNYPSPTSIDSDNLRLANLPVGRH